MRVLILSCDTGGGHNACSEALRESLAEFGVSCQIKDAFSFISHSTTHTIDHSFTLMYRHFPGLFRFGYQFAEEHPELFAPTSMVNRFLSVGTEKLYAFIRKNQFQLVLCPHVFSALMMTNVVRTYGRFVKTCFVATDYTCSPGCAQSDLDLYFIPHSSLTSEFIRKGMPAEKLIVSGIPIRREFFEPGDQKMVLALRRAGSYERHVVLMCGSMGCGPIKQVVQYLSNLMPENCCLTVICGTNKKLREKLTRTFAADQRIMVCGLVHHVALWLESADLFITKPGGISVSEAAHKRLPMLFINAVAGCEEYNLLFFLRRGVASTAKTPEEIARQAVRLLRKPKLLKQMADRYENIEPLSTTSAAQTIAQYIVQQADSN